MHNSLLQSLGLSPDEASVYELMLELGVAPIQKILPKSGLKRGTLYNVLRRLVEQGLIVEKEGAKKATFEVAPPAALEKLMSAETTRIEENKKRLADSLPQLASLYNLAMHKPNVQFFEGIDGIQKVSDDSLTAKTQIYSYIDSEAIHRYIPKLNLEYKKRFVALKLKEKILEIDTPSTRERLKHRDQTVVETRLLKGQALQFATIMKIYDNKISYITLDEKIFIGIIIEEPHITATHRILFEQMWALATPLTSTLPPAPSLLSKQPSQAPTSPAQGTRSAPLASVGGNV